MSRIFLSHSSSDDFEAVALRDWLAAEGWNDIFLDFDPDRGIVAGERWERALHEAANRCEAVLFIVSTSWLDSGWCRKEYYLANRLNKKLFAVLVDSTKTIDELPPELSDTWQITDLANGRDGQIFRAVRPGSQEERQVCFSRDGLRRLRRGLQKAGLEARFFSWPPEGEPDRAPYRGLKALEAADAGIFFGRDAPIVEATDRLRGLATGAAPRLFVILGASGAGKSSFLQAGLLPRLARDDSTFLPLPPIRPGRAALNGETGLLRALETVCPRYTRAQLREAMKAGADGIRPLLAGLVGDAHERTLAERASRRAATVVIAIDQAEELFRPDGAQEGSALLSILRDLTRVDEPAVIAIFAIRSDSYDVLEHAKPLEGLGQATLPLLPLPQGAYKELIEGPARRMSRSGHRLVIEPRLTERLLEDIEAGPGSDALPLLAFVLAQLYEEYHRAGELRLADYETIGGLKGAIQAAVERAFVRADQSPAIPPDRASRETLLHKGFIPWLCGIDPESRTPRRNIASRSDIPADALPLIDLLVEERLLSSDSAQSKDPVTGAVVTKVTIEPAHEALLRQWDLLHRWLDENFSVLVALEGLKRAAREWDANDRAAGWLAHQVERLAEAQGLDAYPDIAAKLDAIDRAYLVACRRYEDAAHLAEETRRREREQERERQLVDAQRIAASAKRAKMGLGAALVLLAIALGIAAFATTQTMEAQRQTDRARKARVTGTRTANDLIFDVAKNSRKDGASNEMAKAIVDLALKLQDDLIDKNETDPGLLQSRGKTLAQTARILRDFDELPKALNAAEKSRDAFRDLLAKSPSDRRRMRDLAASHEVIGAIEEARDPTAALATYRQGVAIRRRLAETHDVGATRDLAASLRVLAEIELSTGDRTGAMATYDEAVQVIEAVPDTPKAVAALHDRAGIYEEIADVKDRAGDPAGALAQARKALAVEKKIGVDDGTAGQKRGIATALDRVADLAAKVSGPRAALPDLEASLVVRRDLASSGTDQARRDLVVALLKLADLKSRLADDAGALALYRDSLGPARFLAKDDRDLQAQRDLAAALDGAGWSAMRLDDVLAPKSLEESVAIRERLATRSGAKPDTQRDWAIALTRYACALRRSKQLDDAFTALDTSLSIRRRLGRNLGEAAATKEAAVAAEAIAALAYDLLKVRRFDKALTAADHATASNPRLTLAHLNRAHALMLSGRPDDAKAVHLAHRREHLPDGTSWETAALADFTDLRRTGLAMPAMDLVEHALADHETQR